MGQAANKGPGRYCWGKKLPRASSPAGRQARLEARIAGAPTSAGYTAAAPAWHKPGSLSGRK